MIKIKTNKGEINIELDENKAPITCENFKNYINKNFYDGLIFHRVIKGFMIQGGGMDVNMKEATTDKPIQNEADNGLLNKKGTIAMARTSDPHSATAQFFINTNDNNFLNHTAKNEQGWGYCVFGKVISGMDVVEEIENSTTGNFGFHADVPTDAITIKSISIC
jgi:peptidyl-prolyl cis-trans isomerase B (cyclophilin B)